MIHINTWRGFTQLYFLLHLREKVAEGQMRGSGNAFTLIELLVVVVIIGILAAVAVPQYQKAVWRSRNTQLKTLVSSIAKAQNAYYLDNGTYAQSLNQLDVDLPKVLSRSNRAGTYAETCPFVTSLKADSVRYAKDFLIGIASSGTIMALWISGPYKCGGFVWQTNEKNIACTERAEQMPIPGTFCNKLEHATYQSQPSTFRFYRL